MLDKSRQNITNYRDRYIKTHGSVHKATTTIPNLCAPDNITSKCRKQKLIKL